MRLIHGPALCPQISLPQIALRADRVRLAKRRWRGFAEDGTEFGFDLEFPLRGGSCFFYSDTHAYVIEQLPEPVIDIFCPREPSAAARLGWVLGNLHFPIEVLPDRIRICDDSAVRQLVEREGFTHELLNAVFEPLSGAHSHGV